MIFCQSTFIDRDDELASACARWQKVRILSLDTEFIRTNTFYPIPALIQIYDGTDCYLIDPVSIKDMAPLRDVLVNPAVVKVLHSCGEDLEVFDRLFGVLPTPLFDTQIVAALLGYGFSVGYARLIKTFFQVELPKDETRSNWLQRPLSQAQLDYATLDVIYLYRLYEKFSPELDQQGKRAWSDACSDELAIQFRSNQDPSSYFSKIKNAWKLDPSQQAILYRLSLWREKTARQKNKPRNHILRDDALFEIALRAPTSQEDLSKMRNLPPPALRHHGRDLLAVMNDHTPVSLPAQQEPLPKELGALLKLLQEQAEACAQRLNVAPEMLLRKKDLHALVASRLAGAPRLPASLEGWRRPIIGNTLLQLTEAWPSPQPA